MKGSGGEEELGGEAESCHTLGLSWQRARGRLGGRGGIQGAAASAEGRQKAHSWECKVSGDRPGRLKGQPG